MRINSLVINDYKNLKNFEIQFDGTSFIDIFVGRNGTGKSNLLEALLIVFWHLRHRGRTALPSFEYKVSYTIDNAEHIIESVVGENEMKWNGDETLLSRARLPLPDHVLTYYSGHNALVSSVVDASEEQFRSVQRGATAEQNQYLVGIGPSNKELVIAVLLLQPVGARARQFVCEHLEISGDFVGFDLTLSRPTFADGRLRELKVEGIEIGNAPTYFWGALGETRRFLDTLVQCIRGEYTYASIYDATQDVYRLSIDAALFREKFPDCTALQTFQAFDRLKATDLLGGIAIEIETSTGRVQESHFSDGEFQTIYIYAMMEIFKERDCLFLLDEPDSFLHPKWQFEFINNIRNISDTAADSSHVLMCSHSAVTLLPHEGEHVGYFDLRDGAVNSYRLPKRLAVTRLSEEIFTYSEERHLLSIINAIQIEGKPVLFAEGSTDPIILRIAWEMLFEEDEIPFIPFYAFGHKYLKQLLEDPKIHHEMDGLPLFGLFDFDAAFDSWNGMSGTVERADAYTGLVKNHGNNKAFALMLPIPRTPEIEQQVFKVPGSGSSGPTDTFGGESCCAIEHLFYGHTETESYFTPEPTPGSGTKFVFNSRKTDFAQQIVPTLAPHCFEVFRPLFEFIRSKCPT